MKKILKTRVLPVLMIPIMVIASVVMITTKVQAASCTPPADYGKVTTTVTIPSTGDYRVWSRIKAVDSTHNTYLIKIDNTCYNVGGNAAIPNGAWKWVDYQDGNTATKIQLTGLTAGSHNIEFIGNADGVELDRIIFTQDFECLANASATDLGDTCASGVTVSPGDVNGIAPVDSADLSILSSNFGKAGPFTKTQGNLDNSTDGKVTSADLSILSNYWGK